MITTLKISNFSVNIPTEHISLAFKVIVRMLNCTCAILWGR
jgi:hypothetical protein